MSEPATVETAADADAPEYRGVIVLEWPASYGYSPYSAMPGALLSIFDALTGKPIITCLSVTIHADQAGQVTADLLMLTDEHGQPDYDAAGWAEGDDFPTAVFPFFVSEMRVRAKS